MQYDSNAPQEYTHFESNRTSPLHSIKKTFLDNPFSFRMVVKKPEVCTHA